MARWIGKTQLGHLSNDARRSFLGAAEGFGRARERLASQSAVSGKDAERRSHSADLTLRNFQCLRCSVRRRQFSCACPPPRSTFSTARRKRHCTVTLVGPSSRRRRWATMGPFLRTGRRVRAVAFAQSALVSCSSSLGAPNVRTSPSSIVAVSPSRDLMWPAGSGKTWSMMGDAEHPGVTPLLIRDIFRCVGCICGLCRLASTDGSAASYPNRRGGAVACDQPCAAVRHHPPITCGNRLGPHLGTIYGPAIGALDAVLHASTAESSSTHLRAFGCAA